MISLDGTSGGGQMLRTALSLSMVTGQPFRMVHIRGQRRKPGLMRQHLTCVKAACEISAGIVAGAEIGSTELTFQPGKIRGGDYHFAIGTAGSTALLFQTLLPALLRADAPSRLRLEGGTHNPLAPPFEFLERVFLPTLRRMGADATISLVESGFAPVGGGIIESNINPCARLTSLELRQRGGVLGLRIRVPLRNLSAEIGQRMLAAALEKLPCEDAAVESREPGPGRGVCCLVEAAFEHLSELASSVGEQGMSAERVGARAAKTMHDFIGSGAAVGRQLADQILLPLALAGCGSFTTMAPDEHVPTNIAVIEQFLPVKFRITEAARGTRVIAVAGA